MKKQKELVNEMFTEHNEKELNAVAGGASAGDGNKTTFYYNDLISCIEAGDEAKAVNNYRVYKKDGLLDMYETTMFMTAFQKAFGHTVYDSPYYSRYFD